MDPLSLLIVGGGVHGAVLTRLLMSLSPRDGGVPREGLRVLDGEGVFLARFRRWTAACGMTHLRSPGSHHLDHRLPALMEWARSGGRDDPALWRGRLRRPSRDLWFAHADREMARFGMADLLIADEAASIRREGSGYLVETVRGRRLRTRRLILAPGSRETPFRPAWADTGDPRIHHVFDPGFRRAAVVGRSGVVVVGGGVTAFQLALALIREGAAAPVRLLCRSEPPIRPYDSDPGYIGRKKGAGYALQKDYAERRRMIAEARYPGSVPPDVDEARRREEAAGRLVVRELEVEEAAVDGERRLLSLRDGRRLETGNVVLATGFRDDLPGRTWLKETAR